jgi:biopolymer transport protein TolR
MLSGAGRGPRAEINMTPMIDVLLVLIIIFMVITPLTSRGLDTLVPQDASKEKDQAPAPQSIVVTVLQGGKVLLNSEPLDLSGLQERLAGLFKNHGQATIFVRRGEKDLEFQEVAAVIDIARGAGVSRIALMTH